MKITKPTADPERKVCINLITSDRFCKEIIPLIRPQYFQTLYAREISNWVSEYYEQFTKAPKQDIKSIYHTKRPLISDEETIDLCSTFLASISKEWETLEPNNIDYEIHAAVNYLKLRSLEVLNNSIQDAVSENNPVKGEQALSNFKRVEKPLGQGIDLLLDKDKIADAITKENDTIFTYPGAVGNIIPPVQRGSFISFFGPAKRGKSFWLSYTAEIAMTQGCKVIHIPLEMTDNELVKRMWPSLTGQPLYKRTIHYAHFEENDSGKFSIVQDEKEMEGLDVASIEVWQKKLKRLYRKGKIKIVPMVNATIEDIEALVDNLFYYENYSPDVIVVDYADYMSVNKKYSDNRDRINIIWKGLRDLALKRNIAVATASHTEKKTFESDIKTSQASEDIRKINHVTCAISLNATDNENENNIIRLGLMASREGRHVSDQAVVLQCLDLGRACTDSKMRKEVNLFTATDEEEKSGYKRKNRSD